MTAGNFRGGRAFNINDSLGVRAMKLSVMKRVFWRPVVAVLLLTPVCTGTVLAQTAPAPAAPGIDPARLTVARAITGQMMPNGTYAKLMRDVLPGIVRQMQAAMPGLMLREALRADGVKPEAISHLDEAQLNEIIHLIDPAQQDRARLTQEAIWGQITGVMTAQESNIRDAYAEAFANRFTLTQLNDIRSFFATPSGTVYAAEMLQLGSDPAVQRQVKGMMSTMIQQMPGIMDQARLSTAKLPAPRQLKDLPLKDQARIKQLLGMPAKGK